MSNRLLLSSYIVDMLQVFSTIGFEKAMECSAALPIYVSK